MLPDPDPGPTAGDPGPTAGDPGPAGRDADGGGHGGPLCGGAPAVGHCVPVGVSVLPGVPARPRTGEAGARPRAGAVPTSPVWPVALVGAVASLSLVLACGRAPLPIGVLVHASFAGLLHPSAANGTAAPVVAVVSLAVLVACWWRVLRLAGQGRVGLRAVALTGVAWVLPVALAPPLVSMDAYSYLAQGTMVNHGLDPYRGGPVLLGDDPALARVDPRWRATPAPYGPLALLVLRAVTASQGDLATQVVLLRVVALLGVAAAIGAALSMAPATRRAQVLALCALNPVTLVHLVGGAHLDAIVAGVVGLSLLALRRDTPWLAWLLAVTAVAIKVTAAPLLLFVFLALLRRRRSRAGEGGRAGSWPRLLLGATSLAALPLLASVAGVHRPWAFVSALTVPGASSPWYAPATVLGQLFNLASRVLALPVSPGEARLAARLLVFAAGFVAVLRLARDERAGQQRSGDRPGDGWQSTVRRASLALLVTSVCLPAVYGWYVGAGLFGLAAVADRRWCGRLVALCSCFMFTALPPLWSADRWVFAAACAVGLAVLVVARRRDVRATSPVPGRTGVQVRAAARWSGGDPGVPRRYGRVAQVAGLGLVVPALLGVLSPGASASVVRDREQVDRTAVVEQLLLAYPDLQVGTVLPAVEPFAAYRVELVVPGDTTCVLLVGRRAVASTTYPLMPHGSGRTPGLGGECPLPLPNLLAGPD